MQEIIGENSSNGRHEDCSYIELTNKNGNNALQVVAAGYTPLSFSALPYSVADLYAARHDFELKQSGNPNLRYTVSVSTVPFWAWVTAVADLVY